MRPSCTKSDRCSGLINAFGSVVAFAAAEEDLDQNSSYVNDRYGRFTTHKVKKLCVLDKVNVKSTIYVIIHIVLKRKVVSKIS